MQLEKADNHLGKLISDVSSLDALPRCVCPICTPVPQRTPPGWHQAAQRCDFGTNSFPLLQLLLFLPTTCEQFQFCFAPRDSSGFVAPHLTAKRNSVTGQAPHHCV